MLTLNPGDTFAGCLIVDVCGHGGFGTVYLAEDAVGRRIAVKLVNAIDKDAELRGIRLYMEHAPDSPYLLAISHVGIERGELYYLMDAADPMDPKSPVYIADTLGRRLKLRGRLSPEAALATVRKLALAVEALHGAGLIHRDIKPDNIIFVNGEPKLSDPGLLRPAECSATLAGTLGFLPPEVLSGAEEMNTPHGDVYALGKVLYCAFTGENPGHFPHLPRDLGMAACRKLLPVLLRVCNENPKRRYADIGEFRRALPEKLPGPGPLERLNEKFRMWKLMHSILYRAIVAAVLALLCLGAWGAVKLDRIRREQAALYAASRNAAQELVAQITAGGKLLELQLERSLGPKDAQMLLNDARKMPKRPLDVLTHCDQIRRVLHNVAAAEFGIAERTADPLKHSGYIRELLDSPLGGFLIPEQRRHIVEHLEKYERKNLDPDSRWAPKPGKTYSPDASKIFEFAYVPPGNFISPRTGKHLRIDYPMWVGKTEMSVRQFSRIAQYIPAGNREPDTAVNSIVFNDLLYVGQRARELFGILGPPLPQGYIVRPLAEEEWEYCALSGMRDDPKNFKPGQANRFGLYGMRDGLREIVLSDDRTRAGSYVVRGGTAKTPPDKVLTARTEIAFYQSFMKNTGARLAIAPGDDRIFDREFRSSEVCHFAMNGKHYEFFGQLAACIPQKNAAELCALLGGRLAVLEDPAVVERLRRTASPVFHYPVLAGATFREGAWYWDGSGKAMRKQPPPPRKGEMLTMENGQFRLWRLKAALAFVCEWSESEWRSRKTPSSGDKNVLAAFEIDGTCYALIQTGSLYPHLSRRFAEILGGRLAEPESPELRRKIARAMGRHAAEPTLVGGIWKQGGYQWIGTGHRIEGDLPLAGVSADNARSLAAPALMNGDLCATQMTLQFLMELPARPASRR